MNEILKPYNEYFEKDRSKVNMLEKIEMRVSSSQPQKQVQDSEEAKNSEEV